MPPSSPTTSILLRELYGGPHDPEEVALAARMLHDAPPPDAPELFSDFLDFFVIEWVDANGYSPVELAVEAGRLPAQALRLSREVRTALWVVDGWEGDLVMLRDLATEADVAVYAPAAKDDLPRRTVLRARVVPEVARDDQFVFSGSPDLYDGLGVIARMDLLRAWQETPEPDLIARLGALRQAFTQQREEQSAFVHYFGADERVFNNADDLADQLARFMNVLGNEWTFGSLGGRTRADAHRVAKGAEPKVVQVQLGESLRGPGRPGIIYDRVHGVHFLPRYGELLELFAGGVAGGPTQDVLRFYEDEPGLSALAFRSAPAAMRTTKTLGRAVPSVLPGGEE
ncbi:MAG: hypothetical protein EXR69_13065 [Myxococcales bacterium]|nr:hypothetical protein [Myxococcales bacterium]